MSVNDAIKGMLYGHEHRWRVAEHELEQARSDIARVTAERDDARKEAAYWCDEAEGMEAIALTAIDGPPECPKGRRIVQEIVDTLKAARAEAAALRREVERLTDDLRVARSDAATCGLIADGARRGTAEAMALVINHEGAIDRLTTERDALKAEVETMREVESDARRVVDHWRDGIGLIGPVTSLRSDLDALDALRARRGVR